MSKRVLEGEIVSNRKAYHDYEVLESIEAGIVLRGTEIKSLREGGGNLLDNYVSIEKGEPFLKLSSIAPYKFGNIYNHEEKRSRKLLLHKHEIAKLKKASELKGLTLIALSFYLKKGKVKVKLGLCRGKTTYDKRNDLRKKEHQKEMRI
jgi:SsrA-binding protein